MTVKKKVPVKNKTSVNVNAGKDEAVAKKLTRPEVRASLTIQKLHPINDVNALTKILRQAHTLDALFNSLVMKGLDQTHMRHYDGFLRLAYKAQSQCRSRSRSTLQTV
ncbi:hypothetical protein BCS42_16070 [Crenothrix sp. D3]|nr:hypothetical protein BCS42_16070 [Crenothrix sp. D3]